MRAPHNDIGASPAPELKMNMRNIKWERKQLFKYKNKTTQFFIVIPPSYSGVLPEEKYF